MTKRVLAGLFALTLPLGAAACGGDDKIDRSAAVDELVGTGLSQEQAECTVDKIIAEYGDNDDVLGGLDDLSDEDQAKITDMVTECLLVDTSATTVGG